MTLLKKYAVPAIILTAALSTAGCGLIPRSEHLSETFTETMSVEETFSESVLIDIPSEDNAFIFITTNGTDFTRYPYEGEADASMESLIMAVAEKTGWQFGEVSIEENGREGIIVHLPGNSCAVTGEADDALDGYVIEDNDMMKRASLESIKKTLQYFRAPDTPDGFLIRFVSGDGGELLP